MESIIIIICMGKGRRKRGVTAPIRREEKRKRIRPGGGCKLGTDQVLALHDSPCISNVSVRYTMNTEGKTHLQVQ